MKVWDLTRARRSRISPSTPATSRGAWRAQRATGHRRQGPGDPVLEGRFRPRWGHRGSHRRGPGAGVHPRQAAARLGRLGRPGEALAASPVAAKKIDAKAPAQIFAASPGGAKVATAGADKIVRIWKADDGALIKELPAAEQPVVALALKGDGALVAVATGDKIVQVFQTADAKATTAGTPHTRSTISGV